jgi:hypothetical protein
MERSRKRLNKGTRRLEARKKGLSAFPFIKMPNGNAKKRTPRNRNELN